MDNAKYAFLIVYLLCLAALGFRPKIPFFYNWFLSSSDVWGWCMYQWHVSQKGVLTINYNYSTQELDGKNL